MKRIVRDRRLTPEEIAKYDRIREQVREELPELIKRHHQRMPSHLEIIKDAYTKCDINFVVLCSKESPEYEYLYLLGPHDDKEQLAKLAHEDYISPNDFQFEFDDGQIGSY